ncbi:MAG: hypothetical protein DMG96_37215 [Acidobacteria bacterium]|nr:MAG: hypothetical protein DMG96_37215 [Acidobacteriota bacterium]
MDTICDRGLCSNTCHKEDSMAYCRLDDD